MELVKEILKDYMEILHPEMDLNIEVEVLIN
jgi:hypothetical protein